MATIVHLRAEKGEEEEESTIYHHIIFNASCKIIGYASKKTPVSFLHAHFTHQMRRRVGQTVSTMSLVIFHCRIFNGSRYTAPILVPSLVIPPYKYEAGKRFFFFFFFFNLIFLIISREVSRNANGYPIFNFLRGFDQKKIEIET